MIERDADERVDSLEKELRSVEGLLQTSLQWHQAAVGFTEEWDLDEGDVEDLELLIADHHESLARIAAVLSGAEPEEKKP